VVFPEPMEHLSDDFAVTGEVRMRDEQLIWSG
jgi:hypothetical protein